MRALLDSLRPMTQPHSNPAVRVPASARISVDVSAFDAEADLLRLPTVRIFVATGAGHERAERVVAWSIRQLRSPARSYAIYWIRPRDGSVAAVDDGASLVAELCDREGRALLCTVDQVFLSDPADLFDHPMNGCAILAPAADDPSLLLIDCAKWAEAASNERGGCALDRMPPHLRGRLPVPWEATPDHYSVGRSRRVRYAAAHTQPWRPFPDRFVYQQHANADVWQRLERGAHDAGFELFSRSSPSVRFRSRVDARGPSRTNPTPHRDAGLSALLDADASELVAHDFCIRASLAKLPDRRLSIYTIAAQRAWRDHLADPPGDETAVGTRWGATGLNVLDPDHPARGPNGRADAVVCDPTLGSVPTEDLAWVLGEVFASATSLVHFGIRPESRLLRFRSRRVHRTIGWWIGQIEAAARLHPRVHWQVVFAAGDSTEVRHGGRHLVDTAPTVWVLTDDRPGNTSQSTGLANALGWPYQIKSPRFSQAARLHNRLLGDSRIGIDRRRSTPLVPPWPDLVIAAGRRSAPVAQWIRKRNFGQTRLVHLGRKGGDAADQFDLVVTPAYGRLDPHPRRLVTTAPINNIAPDRVQQAIERFSDRLMDAKRPRIAVLVGGWSGQYQLDSRTARALGEHVADLASEVGGSILATSSRRAGARGTDAFFAALPADAHVYRWSASNSNEQHNPYQAFLGLADAFVITGDSESMLSEAASLGRPIYIYPLPERVSFGWMRAVREWVYDRAHARHGGIASQRGVEHWCARMIDLGFVRPVRDLRDLHEGLIHAGVARHFGDPFDTSPCKALGNEEKVVERVCALLGFGAKK